MDVEGAVERGSGGGEVGLAGFVAREWMGFWSV